MTTLPAHILLNFPLNPQAVSLIYRNVRDPVISACDLMYAAENLKKEAARLNKIADTILREALKKAPPNEGACHY